MKYQPTEHVGQPDEVIRFQMSIPKELGEQLREKAGNSEYGKMTYNKRCYHNNPLPEMILCEYVNLKLEDDE